MTSQFQYLHDSLKVTPLDDDHLQVTLKLPSDHFIHFIRTLEALTGFVQTLEAHSRRQRIKHDQLMATLKEEAEHNKAIYHERIAKLYDQYTDQGLNRLESIKLISQELRSENHPWCSVDLVRFSLPFAGRPAIAGRRMRQP